jgi:hypothetical protein
MSQQAGNLEPERRGEGGTGLPRHVRLIPKHRPNEEATSH